jgi:hypothetical protein
LGLKSLVKKLAIAVMMMVQGIKNSTHAVGTVIILRVLKARVMEWPMVKAVIRINTGFQSLIVYKAAKTSMKSW